jgi:hypothetical protein
MSQPHVGASSSRITLVKLADCMIENFDCDCVDGIHGPDEDCGTAFCPCAGDECWHCAALMALANAVGGEEPAK